MIFVGIDDTDTPESRGTNQLARTLAEHVRAEFHCQRITRHQLLDDPRVPYTSKNGSASLVFEQPLGELNLERLATRLADAMRAEHVVGSDPGLCVAGSVPDSVRGFGWRCKNQLVSQSEARTLAANEGILLWGLGGTEDGVIGALAAIGLAADDSDGRVIQWSPWTEELGGLQSLRTLAARGVSVRDYHTNETLVEGTVDVGKKLRPNWRGGSCVLYVLRVEDEVNERLRYRAVKLP